jgi:hypothetical protein
MTINFIEIIAKFLLYDIDKTEPQILKSGDQK